MTAYHSEFITDLALPPAARPVPHQFAMGDNNAYTFTALVCDSTDPTAELMEGTVSGCLLRPDGRTVALEGEKGAEVREVTINGQTCNATPCSVTLPQACFAYPGRVLLTIKLVNGTTATTALAVSGTVVRTETDSAVDPGEIVPDLAELQAAAAEALSAAADAEAAAQHAVRYDTAQTPTPSQTLLANKNISTVPAAPVPADWCISSQKWSNSNQCYVLPVNGGEHISVLTNPALTNPNAVVAGLKSSTMVAGAAVDFSTAAGWTDIITVYNGEIMSANLPADVRYLYIYRGWAQRSDRLPLRVYINGVDIMQSILGRFVPDNEDVECLDFHTRYGYISGASPYPWLNVTPTNHNTSATGKSALIPVKPGDKVEIVATKSTSSTVYNSIYAFVKRQVPTTNVAAVFSSITGYTTPVYVDKGTRRVVTAPADAELLYIYRGVNDERLPDQLRINGYDVLRTLKQNIVAAVSDQPTILRIMQYNIGKYTWGDAQQHMQTEAVGDKKAFSDYVLGYRQALCHYHPDLITLQEYKPTTDVLVTGSSPATYNTEDMHSLLFTPVYPFGYEYLYTSDGVERSSQLYIAGKTAPMTYLGKWYSTVDSGGTTQYAAAIISRYHIGGKTVTFICTGLPWTHTAPVKAAREALLTQILDEFATEEYCFIGLDMNNGGVDGVVTSQEEAEALLALARTKGFDFAMGGYLPFEVTYIYDGDSEYYKHLKLDNIIFRNNGRTILRDFRVLRDEYENLSSDHVPILGEFILL